MRKKTVIEISAAVALVALVLAGVLGFRIWSDSAGAAQAAEDFTGSLRQGELTLLRLEYYFTEELEAVEDSGEIKILSREQLAEQYGSDLVMAGWEEETEEEDKIFALVMAHSQVETSAGAALRGRANMRVILSGPDLQNWRSELSNEEQLQILFSSDALADRLQTDLAAGTIPQRTIQFVIPVIRQNGKWRFQVTDDMEAAFYGNLYKSSP